MEPFFALSWAAVWAFLAPVVKTIAILLVGHLVVVLVRKLLDRSFARAKLDPSLIHFLTHAAVIVMYVIIGMMALSALGISTTGIVTALSAAAVAVSLALKDSLSNVAGGILLLFSPRFLTGDYIAAGGDEGTVLDVDLLHTSLLTPDSRQVSIPNGVLINHHITNYSRQPNRRVDITFSIAYEADAELAKKLILDTIAAHTLVTPEAGEPFVRIKEFADSSVNIVSRCWCKTPDYWTVYFDLMEQVRAAFDANGISIPYNQLDVHVKNDR